MPRLYEVTMGLGDMDKEMAIEVDASSGYLAAVVALRNDSQSTAIGELAPTALRQMAASLIRVAGYLEEMTG